jgi:hypothetical protein
LHADHTQFPKGDALYNLARSELIWMQSNFHATAVKLLKKKKGHDLPLVFVKLTKSTTDK